MKFAALLHRIDRIAWATEVFGVRISIPLPRRIPRWLRGGERRRPLLQRLARWGFAITWDPLPSLPEARVVRGGDRWPAEPQMPRELAAWTAEKVVGVLEARAEVYIEAEKERILTAHEMWEEARRLHIAEEMSIVLHQTGVSVDVAAAALRALNGVKLGREGGT